MTFNMHLFIFLYVAYLVEGVGLGTGETGARHVDGLYICDGHLSLLMWSCGELFKAPPPPSSPSYELWPSFKETNKSMQDSDLSRVFVSINLQVCEDSCSQRSHKQSQMLIFFLGTILHLIQNQPFWNSIAKPRHIPPCTERLVFNCHSCCVPLHLGNSLP